MSRGRSTQLWKRRADEVCVVLGHQIDWRGKAGLYQDAYHGVVRCRLCNWCGAIDTGSHANISRYTGWLFTYSCPHRQVKSVA